MYKDGYFKYVKRILKLSPLVGLVLVMLISSAASTALAQSGAKVKVLIAFSRQPGPAEQALVRGVGGDINYTYHLVPAIAASVPEAAIEGLRKNPIVTGIDPDLEVQIVDAELDNTWGVKRIGAGAVHADGNRGTGVKVAVLDTGIDTDHPDLNYDPTCSASFIASEPTLEDGHSHGTHTAGTVAALDNDTGVVGVAPKVTLCIYKVFDSNGNGSYSDIAAAIERAVDDGVQVTNNSYGGSGDPGPTIKAAFDNASAAGVLHVAAAGNNGNLFGTGENCIYPARWPSVIATAATMQDDTRAYFSSTCPEVELAAPGNQIKSTMPGGGTGDKSGTSMASPHVAGTAALVLAANPSWSNDAVRTQLQSTADDLGDPGRDPWYGYGLVDAVRATNNPPLADDQSVMTTEDTPVAITLTGSDPDGDPLTYSVVTGPANGSLSGSPPNLTYTPNPDFNGADSFTFKVNDGTEDSNIAIVSIAVNPVNDRPLADNQSVTTDEDTPVAITLTGSDPEGNPLTFSVMTSPVNGSLNGSAPNLTYTPNPDFNGSDSFTFIANDGAADSVPATVSMTVIPVNDPPTATFISTCTHLTCDFDASASSDPDGSIVSYSWNFGDGNGGSGATASHTFAAAGSYNVMLTATDDGGATGTDTQSVTVTEPPPMHVGDLDGTNISNGKNWQAQVTIAVHDASHQAVADATVNGTWSGGWSGSSSCTTGAGGACAVTSGDIPKKSSSATFTVSSVDQVGFTYNPADNHDPDGNSNGTAIQVNKDGTTSDPGGSANQPPTATFSYTCSNLTCSFDASGSSNADGSIVDYAWDFGDGNNGSGVTAGHTFAAPGTYNVVLSVTDDGGATGSDTQSVLVSDGSGGMTLTASGYKVKGVQNADLKWTGAGSAEVDIYRDEAQIVTMANDGFYTDNIGNKGSGSYTYQVCEAGTTACSNEVVVTF